MIKKIRILITFVVVNKNVFLLLKMLIHLLLKSFVRQVVGQLDVFYIPAELKYVLIRFHQSLFFLFAIKKLVKMLE